MDIAITRLIANAQAISSRATDIKTANEKLNTALNSPEVKKVLINYVKDGKKCKIDNRVLAKKPGEKYWVLDAEVGKDDKIVAKIKQKKLKKK